MFQNRSVGLIGGAASLLSVYLRRIHHVCDRLTSPSFHFEPFSDRVSFEFLPLHEEARLMVSLRADVCTIGIDITKY